MSGKPFFALLAVVLLLLTSVAVFAQEGGEPEEMPMFEMPPPPEGAEVVAEGLNYPRHVTIGPDGTIYVAEAGLGGDQELAGPFGVVPFGFTGSVTAITADGQTPFITNLPGIGGEPLGPSGVAVTDDALWVVMNGFGPGGFPMSIMGSLLKFDLENQRLIEYLDLATFEAQTDADGHGFDSNPVAVAIAPDGTIYIVETGANAIYRLTAGGDIEVWHVWPENPVPTALDFGPDGNIYVSFLGAELAPGAGMVQVLSPDGEVVETYAGFTTLTDVVVADDGTIYAVALIGGFGEQGPLPGQILRVNAEGGEVVVDGLVAPYGMALDDDGSILVSIGTVFTPPGSGMVLRFPAPGM